MNYFTVRPLENPKAVITKQEVMTLSSKHPLE